MKLSLMTAAAIGAEIALAAPVVGNVGVSGVAGFRKVMITYDLSGGDAIVTMDIQTNTLADASGAWVSVGGKAQRLLVGAVNRRVAAGTSLKAMWRPDPSFCADGLASLPMRAALTAWSLAAPPPYMAIDLDKTAGKTPQWYPDEGSLPEGIESDVYRTDKMVLRKIPARGVTWRMGSPEGEIGRDTAMESNHLVRLTHDYYLGVFEVTQAQLKRVYGKNGSYYQGNADDWATRPAENCQFAQIRDAGAPTSDSAETRHASEGWKFFGMLRTFTGLGLLLDLPTEAQWEYACRAGRGTAFYDGTALSAQGVRSESLDAIARNRYNGGMVNIDTKAADPSADCSAEWATARVGSYSPNEWGLYDMLGNVGEMCLDACAAYTNAADSVSVDPLGRPFSEGRENYFFRVVRGGAFNSVPAACRSAARANVQAWTSSKTAGFRVAYGLGDGDTGEGSGSVNELAPYGSDSQTDYWTTTGYAPTSVAEASVSSAISLAGGASTAASSEIDVGTHAPAMVITIR